MKRAAALALVAAVFLVGLLVGALGAHVAHVHRRLGPLYGEPPHLGLVGPFLDRRLDLTREQRQEIDEILARHHQQMLELRETLEPQVREHFEATRRAIEEVLTAEQRERFRRLRPSFVDHHRHGPRGFDAPLEGEAPDEAPQEGSAAEPR